MPFPNWFYKVRLREWAGTVAISFVVVTAILLFANFFFELDLLRHLAVWCGIAFIVSVINIIRLINQK